MKTAESAINLAVLRWIIIMVTYADLFQGKSTICSKLIENIQERDNMEVIYYFCSHEQSSSKLPNEILRNLTAQLLAINPELALYVLENFANNGARPQKKNLATILEKLIALSSLVRVIVDGLDECSQSDHEEIIDDLLRIRGPAPGTCKVLLSSRKILSISKILQDNTTIGMDDHRAQVDGTISSFVDSRLRSMHEDFSRNLLDDLGRQIIVKANGKSTLQFGGLKLSFPRHVSLGSISHVSSRRYLL